MISQLLLIKKEISKKILLDVIILKYYRYICRETN